MDEICEWIIGIGGVLLALGGVTSSAPLAVGGLLAISVGAIGWRFNER